MAVRIESHAGVTKLHPGRFLDQSEPAHLPLGKQAIDGRVSSEKVKVGSSPLSGLQRDMLWPSGLQSGAMFVAGGGSQMRKNPENGRREDFSIRALESRKRALI